MPREKIKPGERLLAVAIIRNGEVRSTQFCRSHRELRQIIDPDGDPNVSLPGDLEGFVTTNGRFLSRGQAVRVGIDAGQLDQRWREARRELLSSDIDW